MGQQKNHGDYSLREWSSLFANPLASKLADVFKKKPPSQQSGRAPLFFWIPTLGNFFISRKARKAGPLAKRVSDVFSKFRASSIVKGFENAAPAWLAQASPCAFPIRVYPCHPWLKFSGKNKRHTILFRVHKNFPAIGSAQLFSKRFRIQKTVVIVANGLPHL